MAKRFVIESSVVRSAVGFGSAEQAQAIRMAIGTADPFTSTYLRMEFIRGVICPMAQMAAVVRNYDSCTAAFAYLQQDFSQRDVKVYLQVAGILLDRSVPRTPAAWAETIASEALLILRRFDRKFRDRRIKNKSKCQIGGSAPEVDYDSLVDDLNAYCREFLTPIQDCEINEWLDLKNPSSQVAGLIDRVADDKVQAVEELRKLKATHRHITCRQCCKIGDAVIALEQPTHATLVYSDAAFDTLCAVLGIVPAKIPSVVAAERSANPQLPPL